MRQTYLAKFHITRKQWLPTILALAALHMTAATAAPESQSGVLEEVQTMLEAGMSEPIILKWLDGSAQKPERPSAADLIALKKAGASDKLLARLLELADAPASESAAAKPREPMVQRAKLPAEPPVAAAPPAVAKPDVTTTDEIPVYFELSYLPDFGEDEDEWQLYVYIDGEPLTIVPAGSLLSTKPLRFRQYFTPGKHTLRVTQERHAKRGRNRWFHAARMAEIELPLEIDSGTRADVELKFRQSQFAFGSSEGPLSFRLVQGKNIQVVEKQGGDPEDWPLVCEEIEANAEDGEELKKSLRRQLDDCTHWSALWGGLEVPGRDEVREALALFRYRPIPNDQPLD